MKKSLLAMAALAACGDIAMASSGRNSCDRERGHTARALAQGGLLANVDSATLNDNTFMQAFGNSVVASGTCAVASAPAQNDVIRIMRIPAGTKVSALLIGSTDMDTGTAALAVSIGYAPVDSNDGPTASAAYFKAAGDLVLSAANDGKLYCTFAPVTFAFDVYLTMTVGTIAATFAAGTIYAVALGEARGIK